MSTSTLLATIKANQLKARFAKDAKLALFLTTLFSEAENTGLNDGKRPSTDTEVLATIRKFIKNAEETLKHSKDQDVQNTSTWEIQILNSYLPKQLTTDDMTDIVRSLTAFGNASNENIGTIMAHFKKMHTGQYDGKVLSVVIKTRFEALAKEAKEVIDENLMADVRAEDPCFATNPA